MSYPTVNVTINDHVVGQTDYPGIYTTTIDSLNNIVSDLNNCMDVWAPTVGAYTSMLEAHNAIYSYIISFHDSLYDNTTSSYFDVELAFGALNTYLTDVLAADYTYKDNVIPADALSSYTTSTDAISNMGVDDDYLYYVYDKANARFDWLTTKSLETPDPVLEPTVDNSVVKWEGIAGGELGRSNVIISDDDELSGHGITITTDTTIGVSHKGMVCVINSGGATTITLESANNTTNPGIKGFQCMIVNRGTGVTKIESTSTIEAKTNGSGEVVLDGQHSAAAIIWLDNSTYGVYGDLSTL